MNFLPNGLGVPNNSGQKFVNIGMKISLISRIILGKCKQKAQEETNFCLYLIEKSLDILRKDLKWLKRKLGEILKKCSEIR